VAETAFGRVACVLEEDLEAPELVRVLAMKGAEVMLYPAREVYGPRQVARQALRATRAYENSVYLAASNEGMGMRNGQRSFVARGRSSINDFTGRCLVEADGAGEALLSGTIDIGALRRARQERGSPVLAGSRMPSFLREMQAVMRGDG
jgi:predicted amidohydrolase